MLDLPNGKVLPIPHLSMMHTTDSGPSLLLITGPPGVGKSCLLHRIFEIAPHGQCLFLPQRAYIPATNTMEQCAVYPEQRITAETAKDLKRIFAMLHLSYTDTIDSSDFIIEFQDFASHRHKETHDSLEYDETARMKDEGLTDPRAKDPFHRLSPGEKQKLALAKAMLMKPKWLFMDEPFSSIDQPTIDTCLQYFFQNDVACVIISHNGGLGGRWPGDQVIYCHLSGASDVSMNND
jgi:ABC-type uncharacterized transport system fused permease/ATPase subunit